MIGRNIVTSSADRHNLYSRIIGASTAALVLMIAIVSFAISYAALLDFAAQSGIDGRLRFLWPLLIDASMIVFSLAVVNAYLQQRSTWRQWSLVAIYTLATVCFNVIHAPDNTTARVVAAVAPISLFFSFEMLMSQLRGAISQRPPATTKRPPATSRPATTKRPPATATTSHQTKDRAAAILRQRMASGDPLPSGAELGRMLGKGKTTGGNLLRELAPVITTNGNGATNEI